MKTYFQNLKAYMADNPEGYWFKRKLYGYGWVPVRWQGWVVTLATIGFMFYKAILFELSGLPDSEVYTEVLIPTFAAVGLLVLICFWKGETPKWSWGLPKEDTRDEKPAELK